MKRTLLLLVLLYQGFTVSANDNLRISDLRTLSLGGSGVTVTPLMNPSLHGWSNRSKLYANYYNRYSVSELATMSGGIYYCNGILPMGLDISSFGFDDYRESLFRLSMGKLLSEHFALGVAFQYALLQSKLFEENSARVSADLGVSYKPVENVLIGLSMLHIPSFKMGDKSIDNEHIGEYSVLMGINWQVINTVLITGSIGNRKDDDVFGSFGLEYEPLEDFSVRCGIKTSPLQPSLGVGYKFSGLAADVGMIYHSVLGVSMGIGISFSF